MAQQGTKECPICLESANYILQSDPKDYTTEFYRFECPRCGKFEMVRETEEDGYPGWERESRERANLSGWLRENDEKGKVVRFDTSFFDKSSRDVDRIAFQSAAAQVRTFHDRANKLLLAIEYLTKHAGFTVDVRKERDRFIALSWSTNAHELWQLSSYLSTQNFINADNQELPYITAARPQIVSVFIAPDGWAHLEKLKESNQNSKIGFMAMPFDKRLTNAWNEGLRLGIERAGYRAIRADETENAD